MIRRVACMTTIVIAIASVGLWLRAQLADSRPLPTLLPPGALLYLEAHDFHSLLTQWNRSGEKARWLKSDNYSVMSRSRLIQRLAQAQEEFVSVAGFPVGMNLVDEVAGTRSALALYHVSYELSFVYITQLPQNRLDSTALWRGRSGYQARSIAGIPFYVKTRKSDTGTRTIAFAAHNGWLILATDESRMGETLALLAGQEARSLSVEPWFKQIVAEQQPQQAGGDAQRSSGDLQLVYNLAALISTPQFRTYWIQRNGSELKPFSTGASELRQRADSFQEQRVLLRKTAAPVSVDAPSLASALQFAPASSSLYRAWASPTTAQVRESIQQVLFGERVIVQDFNAPAPMVASEAGVVGSESDLEIRIDEPPFERTQTRSIEPVLQAINAMQPAALLHVQTTAVLADRVFVLPNSGLVVICKQPDRTALDAAIAQLGTRAVGDLDPLTVSIDGDAVILSRLPLVRQSKQNTLPASAIYLASYDHAAEWPHYRKLFSLVGAGASGPLNASEPSFFSSNVRSLGDSLSRLAGASITTIDQGSRLSETVEYRMQP